MALITISVIGCGTMTDMVLVVSLMLEVGLWPRSNQDVDVDTRGKRLDAKSLDLSG
jgi:hypothetical protein